MLDFKMRQLISAYYRSWFSSPNRDNATDIFIAKVEVDNTPESIFRNHLRKIISDLKIERDSSFRMVVGAMMKFGSGPYAQWLIGTPNQNYREMLREYVIMTGNFSMLTSRYNFHYNRLMLTTEKEDYLKSEKRYYSERGIDDSKLNVGIEKLQDDLGNNQVALDVVPDKGGSRKSLRKRKNRRSNKTIRNRMR